VLAGIKVHPDVSGRGDYGYEESYTMADYTGDYDIVVAKAFRTDEPFMKTKPSGFSWADTWYSDADYKYIEVSSEAPAGYYLADQTWIDSNWVKVNSTYSTMVDTMAYDGGALVAPASGGGVAEWEYFDDTYKTIRPGGIYRYALVVEATYDGEFEFADLPVKPSTHEWTGDVTLLPAYEEVPFGYYAADEDFMRSEWS
jgi:hypothetical protein